MQISLMTMMAMQYLNSPYKWASNGPWDFDCSGLVLKVLDDLGYTFPDLTAQMLHDNLIKRDIYLGRIVSHEPDIDCLLFFGASVDKITHIAIAISSTHMIEAGGAGSNSLTLSEKELGILDARVRIKPIANRRDLVSSFKVYY